MLHSAEDRITTRSPQRLLIEHSPNPEEWCIKVRGDAHLYLSTFHALFDELGRVRHFKRLAGGWKLDLLLIAAVRGIWREIQRILSCSECVAAGSTSSFPVRKGFKISEWCISQRATWIVSVKVTRQSCDEGQSVQPSILWIRPIDRKILCETRSRGSTLERSATPDFTNTYAVSLPLSSRDI